MQRLRIALACLVLLFCVAPRDAAAHFILQDPASWQSQTSAGMPQKLGPCGNEAGGTPTGAITAFQTGQTITITIHEVIFHPGHYRVALAVNDRSELPPEPTVTPGVMACGTVPIMDPPVFPVLADGQLIHTSPFSGPQSFQVTLPAGVTCTHCTLQVIEFMSDHALNVPGGCFYHHCADISIQDVVVNTDGGMSIDGGGGDAGTTPTRPPQACACSAPGASTHGSRGAIALGAIAIALMGRRRIRGA